MKASNATHVVNISNSVLRVVQDATITANSISGSAAYVTDGSMFLVTGSTTVNGTAASGGGLSILNGSVFSCDTNVSIANITGGQAVFCRYGCFIYVGGNLQAYGSSGGNALRVRLCSSVYVGGDAILYGGASTTALLYAYETSGVKIEGKLSATAYSGGSPNAVLLDNCSFCSIGGMDASGAISSATVAVHGNSVFDIPAAATVSGSFTGSGKKYVVDTGGQINVHGAGVNKLPGANAGTAAAASFGYYA